MDNRIVQILNKKKSVNGVNVVNNFNLSVNGSQKLLPTNNINRILDIDEQFKSERENSKNYRLIFKIDTLISNVLFNLTGNNSFETFLEPIFINTPFRDDRDRTVLTYADSINTHLKEIDGWYGYFNPVLTGQGLCDFYDMEPKRERFMFKPDTTIDIDAPINNWDITITYPYRSDNKHYLINNGILLVSKRNIVISGKEMISFGSCIKHNLLVGNTVKITGTNFDGEYTVQSVGLDNGDLKEYFFTLDVNNLIDIDSNSRFKKIYKGVECEYYFRKFKKINNDAGITLSDRSYTLDKLSFSDNIYKDEISQITFNEEVSVLDLKDNLNRPLTEIYLTVLKTKSNNMFTSLSSGIETPFIVELKDYVSKPYLKNIPVIQLIHGVQGSTTISDSYIPLETNIEINNTDFYGDIVEYNKMKLEETVLCDVSHRFNTTNRETTSTSSTSGPRPEGYYYTPHNRVKIRLMSLYIEEGDEFTQNKPIYATNLPDGRFIWRDILDIGTTDIEKLNYPFLNGYHYMYENFCINLKRQDPFDQWDIYWSKFPFDQIGNSLDNKFFINKSENVC